MIRLWRKEHTGEEYVTLKDLVEDVNLGFVKIWTKREAEGTE